MNARRNAEKTHCMRGHEFTPENTRVKADGRRNCAACRRAEKARQKKGTSNGEKQFCGRGHEFTKENTYFRRGNKKNRGCWACRREVHYPRRTAKTYGISVDSLLQMRRKQNGVCALCLSSVCGTLHTDHDHSTGRFREGLCSACNLGLGKFKDDPKLLLRAYEYVLKHERTPQ